MTLVPVDATNAVAVTDYLTRARDWLSRAVDETGPEQIAAAKAEIATAAEATKQLHLSKDIQEDAAEMVRRAEYALGKAVRKGQIEGTVAARENNLRIGPNASAGNSGLVSPTELVTSNRERDDIYAMAEHTSDDFEEVITEAREEGNLSRANVARLAREKSGKPLTERNFQEAELVTAFRTNLRPLMKPKNVSTLSPKARALLIDLLQEAIQTLKEADS